MPQNRYGSSNKEKSNAEEFGRSIRAGLHYYMRFIIQDVAVITMTWQSLLSGNQKIRGLISLNLNTRKVATPGWCRPIKQQHVTARDWIVLLVRAASRFSEWISSAEGCFNFRPHLNRITTFLVLLNPTRCTNTQSAVKRAEVISDEAVWIYVGMLISLWLFLFPIFLFAAQPKEFFFGWVKEVRTTKS
jgi:hypothetical protein